MNLIPISNFFKSSNYCIGMKTLLKSHHLIYKTKVFNTMNMTNTHIYMRINLH